MNLAPPKLLTMLHELIASPSVSSTCAELDQGNRAVVDKLASWLSDLEFKVDIIPVKESASKVNLIATKGSWSRRSGVIRPHRYCPL